MSITCVADACVINVFHVLDVHLYYTCNSTYVIHVR